MNEMSDEVGQICLIKLNFFFYQESDEDDYSDDQFNIENEDSGSLSEEGNSNSDSETYSDDYSDDYSDEYPMDNQEADNYYFSNYFNNN